MRVLSYAYVLYAIIDQYGNRVLLSKPDIWRHIILMRHRERHFMPHFMAVYPDGGLDMRTLQEECHLTATPRLGHRDCALVECIAYIMAVGSEEKRELHLPLMAVFLHVGIEIETGIIQ